MQQEEISQLWLICTLKLRITTHKEERKRMFKLLVSCGYVLMFVAQNFGPEVIEILHGKEARERATAPKYNDVLPDTPLTQLCDGYDSHHFDQLSNCLHAAGMIVAFLTLFSFIVTRKIRVLLTLPPVWYLYAWIGHFFIQKDIPAVFVYGMTLRGWLSGEYCSICSLLSGRTISEHWELVLTGLLVSAHVFLLSPVRGWGLLGNKSKVN